MELGKLIKTLRVNVGATQVDLSEKLGISANYLCLIEANKRTPSDEVFSKIAQLFQISKDALDFLCTNIPSELNNENAKKYRELQKHIATLLLFQGQQRSASF